MSRVYRFAALALLVTGAACGGGEGGGDDSSGSAESAGSSSGSGRTVEVAMVEHAFEAESLGTVKKGETITFKFTNTGTVDHEAFIGDAAAQLAYTEELQKVAKAHAGGGAHGEDGHDDHPDGSIHLAPGESGELTYTFSEAEEVEIACYEDGHYEAGMKLAIEAQ